MRLLFKSNAYKLSEKSTVCIDLTNLSRRIIRGKKNGSRALSPRHVRRTLVTQTNPAVLPSLGFDN